ncbi:MAG: antitoxin VapB family protein [Candidatus Hodarchaeales archaeon]
MASKTISVTEDVYNLLKRMKLPHESFGDTIERLCQNFTAKNLLKWYENTYAWEDMSDEEFDEINSAINSFGKKFRPKQVE